MSWALKIIQNGLALMQTTANIPGPNMDIQRHGDVLDMSGKEDSANQMRRRNNTTRSEASKKNTMSQNHSDYTRTLNYFVEKADALPTLAGLSTTPLPRSTWTSNMQPGMMKTIF